MGLLYLFHNIFQSRWASRRSQGMHDVPFSIKHNIFSSLNFQSIIESIMIFLLQQILPYFYFIVNLQ